MTDIEYLNKYYKGNMEDAIKRLENKEPVQYIVGNVDFYGLIFNVDKRVLIPRFETEGLVEIALKYLNNNESVVDIGTGSGCIAITLKNKNNKLTVDASDISSDAIDVAKSNAKLNNVDINFYQGDCLEPLTRRYDCIISNPPYIAYDEEVMDIVKNNEPNNALYADNNGLYYYEKILKECENYLNKEYFIFFEIGYSQAKIIETLAHKYLDCEVIIERDLQGFDRYIIIKGVNNGL